MKALLQATILNDILQRVISVVPNRSTLSSLENIELNIHEGVFTIKSTDLQMQFSERVSVAIKDKKESLRVQINGRKFADLVATIPEANEVALDISEKKVTLTAPNIKYNFTAQAASDFPDVSNGFKPDGTFEINAEALSEGIDNTLFAVNSDTQGFAMSGLNFKTKDKQLILCATNSRMLGKSVVAIKKDVNADFIVPIPALKLILKSFTDEVLKISFNESLIKVEGGSIILYSRLIDGQDFPNYEAIISALNTERVLTFNRLDFISALKRAKIFSDIEFMTVAVKLLNKNITIEVTDIQTLSDGTDSIASDYAGDEMIIYFNAGNFLAILSAMNSDIVRMKFSEPKKPVVIEPIVQKEITFFALNTTVQQ